MATSTPIAGESTVLSLICQLGKDDIGYLLIGFLSWKDVVALSRCSKYWRVLCEDEIAWLPICGRVWADKTYVPPPARRLFEAHQGFSAFKFAWTDRKRTNLTYEELISLYWNFRFKVEAGPHFQDIDPWANGMDALVNRFESNENHRLIKTLRHVNNVINVMTLSVHRTWRFVDEKCRTIDTRPGASSRFVKGTVNSRDTPTYTVARHSNWGFIMHSCWVIYTSWPMGKKIEPCDEELEEILKTVSVETQAEEAHAYNAEQLGDEDFDEGPDE